MKNKIPSLTAQAKSNLHGQAMIEFTLILSVIILLMIGVMDLARAVYAYGVISNAARDGAHYGALDPRNVVDIEQKTRGKAAALEPGQMTVIPECRLNWDNPYLPVKPEPGDPDYEKYLEEHPDYPLWLSMHTCDPWNYFRVTVYYEFYTITPLFKPFSMYSQSEMMIE